MKIRFLADADLNQNIVAGLLLREPRIDFELPQSVIPDGTPDWKVLEFVASTGRIIVSHDVRTMPTHFSTFASDRLSAGLILVPKRVTIGAAIEDLLLIWQLSEAEEWINQMRRLPL